LTRKKPTTWLIWNGRCQVDKLNYFFFFLHSFNDTFQVQATSTMNQSEIRGLSIWTEPTLIFSVMSYAFYKREFSSKTAYRKLGSHITLIVPAPVSANLISSFQVSKNNFGGRVIKEMFIHAAFLFFFRASYSIIADHMNPANSLATAVTALQGSLPLLTSLR
jgi:hypothetical protein